MINFLSTDSKLEHYTSSLKRSIRRKETDVKSLKQVLHGVLPLIRVQHILPKECNVLKAAIQQGLLQKEMPLDIGEGERQQRSSWIRMQDDRKYVKPRLFAAYVDEAKVRPCRLGLARGGGISVQKVCRIF